MKSQKLKVQSEDDNEPGWEAVPPINRGGRPVRSITESEVERIIEAYRSGIPLKKCCRIVGVSYRTLCDKRTKDPLLDSRIKKAMAEAEWLVSQALFKMALEDKNLAALIWIEKSRFGRRPPIKMESVIEDKNKMHDNASEYLTQEERLEKLAKIEKEFEAVKKRQAIKDAKTKVAVTRSLK